MTARLGVNPEVNRRLAGNRRTYTPTLTAPTSPTLGAGSVRRGAFHVNDGWVSFTVTILFGNSGVSAGDGAYTVSLPAPPFADYAATDVIATGYVRRASDAAVVAAFLQANGQIRLAGSVSTAAHNVPWTWAASDRMTFAGAYEVG
jgi:hypothetical protein